MMQLLQPRSVLCSGLYQFPASTVVLHLPANFSLMISLLSVSSSYSVDAATTAEFSLMFRLLSVFSSYSIDAATTAKYSLMFRLLSVYSSYSVDAATTA